MKRSQKVYLFFKRIIGIGGSFVGIILCFLLLWWWVIPVNAIVTKGHPFFIHPRVGNNKKVFKMIKFRSMRIDANPNLAPSDMSANKQLSMETGFGKLLRKTSIDETPQLLNIFIGQMAFIGPRPGAAKNEEELIAKTFNPILGCENRPLMDNVLASWIARAKTTKNNTEMAFLQVEDTEGSMEVIVFPKVYEKFRSLLKEGGVLVFTV